MEIRNTQNSTRAFSKAPLLKNRFNQISSKIISYVWITLIAVITILPFIWMILNSLKPRTEIAYYRFLPENPTFGNYVNMITNFPFGRWYLNSIIVTVLTVIITLFFCSLAGFALAKYRFAGRNAIFILILATIMVPVEMLIIPWYVGAYKLNLTDTFAGLIIPGMITAFGVFVMRQAALSIPEDLLDAARSDGMSEIGIFVKIIVPLVSSQLSALAIITAVDTWNRFLWPVIVTNRVDMFTLQVGINMATQGQYQDGMRDWGTIMAATTIAALPMLILVILAQKYIVKGIAMSGMKG